MSADNGAIVGLHCFSFVSQYQKYLNDQRRDLESLLELLQINPTNPIPHNKFKLAFTVKDKLLLKRLAVRNDVTAVANFLNSSPSYIPQRIRNACASCTLLVQFLTEHFTLPTLPNNESILLAELLAPIDTTNHTFPKEKRLALISWLNLLSESAAWKNINILLDKVIEVEEPETKAFHALMHGLRLRPEVWSLLQQCGVWEYIMQQNTVLLTGTYSEEEFRNRWELEIAKQPELRALLGRYEHSRT